MLDSVDLSQLSLTDRMRAGLMVRELKLRRKSERWRYFRPTELPDNDQLAVMDSVSKIRGVFGGNRCLGGENLIYDPVKGVSLRVDEIKGRFHVYAWDGKKVVVAGAGQPFEKGIDDLYEVRLSTGEKFVASMSHLVLTPDGYLPLSQLPNASEVFRPLSNLGLFLLTRFSGVRRLMGITRDWIYRCWYGFCLCGEQLRLDTGLNEIPLPTYVPEHTTFSTRRQTDVLVYKLPHTHPYQANPSSKDVRLRSGALCADTLSCVSYKPSELTLHSHRVVGQSKPAFYRFLSIAGFAQLDKLLRSILPYLPFSKSSIITKITYLRRDVKYDFTVFKYHNYFLGGAFHHNSGKTEIGVALAIRASLGLDPRGQEVPTFGRICAPKYIDGCKGVILKKFREMVPRQELRGHDWNFAWAEGEKALYFNNGSKINFKSYEMDLNTYGGDDLDWFWMDEHGPEPYFLENIARITDRNGWGLLTMTPEAGQTWEWDFVTNPPKGVSVDYWFFSTEKNPYLSKEGVEIFKASLRDERLREAKLYGHFVALTGLVYPCYDKAGLKCPDFAIPKHWGRTLVLDPHMRKPSALLWAAWDGDRPVVYRTAKVKMSVEELAKFIRVKSSGEKIDLYIADEAMGGDGKNIYNEDSVIRQLNTLGLPFIGTNQSSDKAFEAGINTVIKYIQKDPISGVCGAKIFESCDTPVEYIDGKRYGSIFWEFERYRFKKEQKSDEENFREKVANVDDDLITCFRYLLMAGPSTYENKIEVVMSQSSYIDPITGW